MSKRKVTDRQAKQIAAMQAKHIKHLLTPEPMINNQPSLDQTGIIVAHYGRSAEIIDENGYVYPCLLRQHLGLLAVGDKVLWRLNPDQSGVIIALLPRHSVLQRLDSHNKAKVIAANIDYIFIITAIEPFNSLSQIDQYLVAAKAHQIQPIIVLNKIDLIKACQNDFLVNWQKLYRELGYILINTSCVIDKGLELLAERLSGYTSVFMGQSGVGKSSLISHFYPNASIKIGALSKATGHGTHTTSTARLYPLLKGGYIIDCPGIREFGISQLTPSLLLESFPEFAGFSGLCQFRDCNHQLATGCALQAAVSRGELAHSRLASYLSLRQKLIQNF